MERITKYGIHRVVSPVDCVVENIHKHVVPESYCHLTASNAHNCFPCPVSLLIPSIYLITMSSTEVVSAVHVFSQSKICKSDHSITINPTQIACHQPIVFKYTHALISMSYMQFCYTCWMVPLK